MERTAYALQVLGGIAVAVGLFAALRWELAVLILGALVAATGTVLEIGVRPRVAPAPRPPTREEQLAHSLADRAAHASGR